MFNPGQDLRFAARALRKNPGFAAAAVLCLMLGIGATTAIFSVVNAVLLRPLPYARSGQLVRIYSEFPEFSNGGLRRFWISPPEYLDLQRYATKKWESIDAWVDGGINLTGTSEPARVTASFVTGGLLRMLGVQPVLGRLIAPADDINNAPAVAVISWGLWQRAFGGDRSVIGRDVHLNGGKTTIVGVMPRDFKFPPGEADEPDLWTPIQIDPAHPGGRGSHFLYLLGLLRQGVTLGQGLAELRGLVAQWGVAKAPNTHAFDPKRHPIVAYGFQDEVVREVRPAMLMLLGAVVFVLLIACVNVANLLLARSESRQREIAIRKALGAELGRLAAQLAVEGVLLSLIGALLGTVLAYGGLYFIKLANAGTVPRVDEISIDARVLLFTLVVAVGTGIVFGLAPMVHLATQNVSEALKAATGRATSAAAAARFRGALVVSELGLALVLLIGAGLMVRAFWKLQEVNSGFNPRGLLTMRLALPNSVYTDAKAQSQFWNALEERAGHIPGVEAATTIAGLPPIRRINANDTLIESFVPVPNGPMQNVDYWQTAGARYFETLRIPLIEGRFFDARDGEHAPKVVIVNQAMARTFWPRQSAIGHRVNPGSSATPVWYSVVGIAADVKNAGLDKPAGTELYFPRAQDPGFGLQNAYLVLKTAGNPERLAGAARSVIRSIDPSLPVSRVLAMEDVMAEAQSRPRFLTLLLTLFSSVALALAAVGIYGVISYSVAQRTGEFGIRMAMGASPANVLGMVIGQGMRLAVAGVVLGALAAAALTRFLSGLLFGVSSFDAPTFVVMTLVLLGVTLAACYIPARRATKVDPMVALRYE